MHHREAFDVPRLNARFKENHHAVRRSFPAATFAAAEDSCHWRLRDDVPCAILRAICVGGRLSGVWETQQPVDF
jgi:hypothetical protein